MLGPCRHDSHCVLGAEGFGPAVSVDEVSGLVEANVVNRIQRRQHDNY